MGKGDKPMQTMNGKLYKIGQLRFLGSLIGIVPIDCPAAEHAKPHSQSWIKGKLAMSKELEDLKLADEHIREAEERIDKQEALVQHLAADGHDTSNAEALLQTFRDTLTTYLDHRKLIIKKLDAQSNEPAA